MLSNKRTGRSRFVVVMCMLAFLLVSASGKAFAKNQSKSEATPDQLSMCIYPVIKDSDGKQYIVTRAGFKVHVPGLGISSQATAIALYGDAEGNFWYVDKKGKTAKMTEKQVEWGLTQFNQQEAMAQQQGAMAQQQGAMVQQPGMQQAPPAGYVQQQEHYGQPPQTIVVQGAAPVVESQSSGASAALVTGLAAAGGAMAGTALTNSLYNNHQNYYGAPYGQPIYNAGGRYYYNGNNGNRNYIPPNAHYSNQWNQQRIEHHKDQFNNLNKNQQQVIKNKAAVNRSQHGTMHGAGARSGGRASGGRAAGARGGGGRRR
jgi:hypothetical protein